ncbi:hypothetical protein C6A85_12760, partial [Mycobacterium sp. ITM-2017-0098]
LVIDAVGRVGSERVWTFVGPKPAGWWVRRRVHETAVHRIDAADGVDDQLRTAVEPLDRRIEVLRWFAVTDVVRIQRLIAVF